VYNLIFSRGTVDLSTLNPCQGSKRIKVNTIFGYGTLVLNPDIPVVIKASSAFGSLELPDGVQVAFGERTYRSREPGCSGECIEIEAAAVFGYLRIAG
jgi:hypothetical protein